MFRSFAFLLTLLLSFDTGLEGPPLPFGEWTVVDWKPASISAMEQDQAKSWLGKTATYHPTLASFGDASCASPRYDTRSMSWKDFYRATKTDPEYLGFRDQPIFLVEVSCRSKQWDAPGAMLWHVDDDHVYALWDGIFFLLERQPD